MLHYLQACPLDRSDVIYMSLVLSYWLSECCVCCEDILYFKPKLLYIVCKFSQPTQLNLIFDTKLTSIGCLAPLGPLVIAGTQYAI